MSSLADRRYDTGPSTTVLVGLEHEFRTLTEGRQVDFRTLLPTLDVAGNKLDPGDPMAIRTHLGLSLTCDYAEAELALPPIELAGGFAEQLLDWVGAGAGLLVDAVGDHEVEGYSTHFSVAVPDRYTHAVCRRFLATFAPALMLLVDGDDSPGLLVRPRRDRVELGTDYVTGEHLVAGMNMAAGGVLACLAVERGSMSPASLPSEVLVSDVAAVERFGWYVDRAAFGDDLYRSGRATTLRLVTGGTETAQGQLERSWKVARAQLEPLVDPDDLAATDELVFGTLAIPLSAGRSRRPSSSRPAPSSIEARTLTEVARPAFGAKVVAATWHYAVFELTGTRTVFASVPRSGLAPFLDRLEAGDLDEMIEAELDAAPRGRLLTTYHQAVGPSALWDGFAGWESLAPPEPDFDGVAHLASSSRPGPPSSVGSSTPGSSTGPSIVRGGATGGSSGSEQRRRKGPPPPPPPPPPRRWPWILIGVLIVLLVGGGLVWLFAGDDPEPQVSLPPQPSVQPTDAPTTTTTTTTTTTSAPPPSLPPPFVVPEGYDDFIGIAQEIGLGRSDVELLLDVIIGDEMGESIYSRSDTPAGFYGPSMDIWDSFSIRTPMAADRISGLVAPGGVLACDAETGGVRTYCAQTPLDFSSGEVIVSATVLVGPVGPDPSRDYTYGSVFESNSDPSDDFVFNSPFDWDLFRDTDTWFIFDVFSGQPAFDVFAGSFADPVASSARALQLGNTLVTIVDAAELPNPSGMRATAFEHDGSFSPAVSGGDVTGDNPTQLFPIEDLALGFDADSDPIVVSQDGGEPDGAGDDGASDDGAEATDGSEPDPVAAEQAAVEQFIVAFDAALRGGDLDFLVERLHPVSVAIGGAGTCDSYVRSEFSQATGLTLTGPVEGPGAVTFNTPDGPVSVEQYTAQVQLTFQGQLFDLTGGYGFVDGRVAWLTSCN